jgi:NADH-quinone oxidoreductase subunit J
MLDSILFYVFAGLALASALVVVAQPRPLYSAFGLIVTLCSLSAIYGLLGSPFIAVLQVVVYAGAIMVLFLFVLMLLNVRDEARTAGSGGSLRAAALALVGVLALEAGGVLLGAGVRDGSPGFEATTQSVARVLFSVRFLYAFEATSILILAALVGAVVLAKKDL